MRLGKLVLAVLALLCAASFYYSSAQSGRTASSQQTPTPDSTSSKSGVGNQTVRGVQKYKVVFPLKTGLPNVTMDSFVEQLNQNSRDGYRLKAATYGWQRVSGEEYSVPVGILQSDESEFEYAWFEVASTFYFAIPGFEHEYSEQAKKGFRLVDHFLSTVFCEDQETDTVAPTPHCKSNYVFLLERKRGSGGPRDFMVAEAMPDWQRKPGRKLAQATKTNLPDGFYPARVLANNQLLLDRTTEKEDFETNPPEVQIVNSSFLNNVKKKVRELGQEGFRLALIGNECAVLYRWPNERGPFVYEWLNAKDKKFEKELARIQASGATFRLVYRDPYGGNQLVFERQTSLSSRGAEYRSLSLSFQLSDPQTLKDSGNVNARLELTPEAKETIELINNLAGEGFVVRDLFVSKLTGSKYVGVLLERSR